MFWLQSRLPFMTICQVSTVDGSPRLERQVQKLTIQMHHQCPKLTAAGYFCLGRSMILKVRYNTAISSDIAAAAVAQSVKCPELSSKRCN